MIVKMNATSAGPDHALIGGIVYDLPAALAKRMLAARTASGHAAATLVVDPKEREKARPMERPVQSQVDASVGEDE